MQPDRQNEATTVAGTFAVQLPNGRTKFRADRAQCDALLAANDVVRYLALTMGLLTSRQGACSFDDLIRSGFPRHQIAEHGETAQSLAARVFGTDPDKISVAGAPAPAPQQHRAPAFAIEWKLLASAGSVTLLAGDTKLTLAEFAAILEFDRDSLPGPGAVLYINAADGHAQMHVGPFDKHGIARAKLLNATHHTLPTAEAA